MRARLGLLCLLVTLLLAVPAGAEERPFQSDNVQLLAKFPEAASAISARFSLDGRTMYVSTATGLLDYDVSKPADVKLAGALPLPHFENEDVDVAHRDGKNLVIISNDPSFTSVGVLYIIDATDPANPSLLSVTPTTVNPDAVGLSSLGVDVNGPVNSALGLHGTGNGHIMNCIADCRYLWSTGTAEGIDVIDIKDPVHPTFLGKFTMPVSKREGAGPGFTHDVYLDSSGVAWITGEDGTFGYDTAFPGFDGKNPKLLYRTDENVTNSECSGEVAAICDPDNDVNPDGPGVGSNAANKGPLDFLHHNSIRTDLNADGTRVPPAAPPVTTTPTAPASPASAPVAGGADAPVTPPAAGDDAPVSGSSTAPAAKKPAKKAKKPVKKRPAKKAKKPAKKAKKAKKPAKKAKHQARIRTTTGGLGNVVAITEEDYTRPGCDGQGSFQTWEITKDKNSDGSTKLKLLDLWTTELNELRNLKGRSDPTIPATANCSAHWFDEANGVVAQGWYDQGVRFLDINDPHHIKQAGYYVTQGTFWAAYYAPLDQQRQIVYALDTAGGIDVLKFDRNAPQDKGGDVMSPAAVRKLYVRDRDSAARYDRSKQFGLACPLLKTSAFSVR